MSHVAFLRVGPLLHMGEVHGAGDGGVGARPEADDVRQDTADILLHRHAG